MPNTTTSPIVNTTVTQHVEYLGLDMHDLGAFDHGARLLIDHVIADPTAHCRRCFRPRRDGQRCRVGVVGPTAGDR